PSLARIEIEDVLKHRQTSDSKGLHAAQDFGPVLRRIADKRATITTSPYFAGIGRTWHGVRGGHAQLETKSTRGYARNSDAYTSDDLRSSNIARYLNLELRRCYAAAPDQNRVWFRDLESRNLETQINTRSERYIKRQ